MKKFLVTCIALICLHPVAFAEGPDMRMTTLELKPIPLLLNVLPGMGGVGFSAEQFIDKKYNYAIFTEAYYTGMDVPNRWRDDAKRESGLLLERYFGYDASLGLNYYTFPVGSSWYMGAKVGYGESKSRWSTRSDAMIRARMSSVMPGLGFGYRWLGDCGGVIRLGLNITGNAVQKNKVRVPEENAENREARSDIKRMQRTPVFLGLDLGLGMAF